MPCRLTGRTKDSDSFDLGSNPNEAIIAGWRSGLSRLAHNEEIAGSNPAPAINNTVISFHEGAYDAENV